jgi:hypothetical protein
MFTPDIPVRNARECCDTGSMFGATTLSHCGDYGFLKRLHENLSFDFAILGLQDSLYLLVSQSAGFGFDGALFVA